MWRDYFRTQYAVFRDTLIFKVRYFNGLTAFPVPVGKDQPAALEEIERYCEENGISLIFCTVPADALPLLRGRYPEAQIRPERNWSDYLYRLPDLLDYPGRKYSRQRNHVHQFEKQCPDYRFEEIRPGNLVGVQRFYERFQEEYPKPGAFAAEESAKTAELLEHFGEYGLFGGCISTGGKIVSFSIGERVNDTLYIHVEKADIRFPGAYQVIVQEFLKHFAKAGDNYVNREEDVGDEGLRKSKLSYHPAALLEKNTVRARPKSQASAL